MTKCELFYSRQVAEVEKRIDRSTRARRKLLHIYLPVFTSVWLPTYLPEHLPARSLVLAACLPGLCLLAWLTDWLPACLSAVIAATIRARILFLYHLSPFNKVSGRLTSLIDTRDTFAQTSISQRIRDTRFFLVIALFIMLPRSNRSPVDFLTSARIQGDWNSSADGDVSLIETHPFNRLEETLFARLNLTDFRIYLLKSVIIKLIFNLISWHY